MTVLTGKRALVTGGSRGIGAAIARRLAADGADVAITYAGSADRADALVTAIRAEGRQAVAIKADAADPQAQADAVRQAADALGGLDILVHNAGVAEIVQTGQVEASVATAAFERQFDVNVGGVFAGTIAAVPLLSDGGRIIIVGSVNGHRASFPGVSIYGATKAAVQGLARGWARDLAPRKILVNVIQPGPIDTDMNPADGPLAPLVQGSVALGRHGKAEEVAAVAAFLASDDSSFVTGTTIDVDGGWAA